MKRPPHRGLRLGLVFALAVAVLAVSPAGGTQASWHDVERVELGILSTEQVGLAVTSGTDRARVTNTSTASEVTWSPTKVTALPVGRTTSAEASGILDGLSVDYRTDSAASQARWRAGKSTGAGRDVTGPAATLAAGDGAELHRRVAPIDQNQLIRRYGARSVTLTTDLTASATAAPSWGATAQNVARYQVPFPAPGGLSCTDGSWFILERPATLTWSWAGSNQAAHPAVAGWEVLVEQNGSWVSWDGVIRTSSGQLRAEISRNDMDLWSSRVVKIRAYPFRTGDGSVDRSTYVDSTETISVSRHLANPVRCGGRGTATVSRAASSSELRARAADEQQLVEEQAEDQAQDLPAPNEEGTDTPVPDSTEPETTEPAETTEADTPQTETVEEHP